VKIEKIAYIRNPNRSIPIPWDKYSDKEPVKIKALSAMAITMSMIPFINPEIILGTVSDLIKL
tara:strand:+ start:120 stop:308 length:189 start_codon:yes stop_codon:yes gene_type:complete